MTRSTKKPNPFPPGTRVQWARPGMRGSDEMFGTVVRRVGSHRQWLVKWESGRISGCWESDIRLATMVATNPEVYPVTAKLEQDLKNLLHLPHVRAMVDVVGEYEHGAADVEDVGVTLEQYTAVVLDICQTITVEN